MPEVKLKCFEKVQSQPGHYFTGQPRANQFAVGFHSTDEQAKFVLQCDAFDFHRYVLGEEYLITIKPVHPVCLT